jgi:hypothetical protein
MYEEDNINFEADSCAKLQAKYLTWVESKAPLLPFQLITFWRVGKNEEASTIIFFIVLCLIYRPLSGIATCYLETVT